MGLLTKGIKHMLDKCGGFSYTPLTDNNIKPAFKGMLLQKIPLVLFVVVFQVIMAQFIQFFNHWPTSRRIAFHFYSRKKWSAFPFYTILNGNAIRKILFAFPVSPRQKRMVLAGTTLGLFSYNRLLQKRRI
jgi:hypothetical protein